MSAETYGTALLLRNSRCLESCLGQSRVLFLIHNQQPALDRNYTSSLFT